ncbi:Terpenoid cyclases/protein prenyltransferase alpha-alpha toroid [Sesbania bispinosa]|nr:Terpenoid cyclases/protein prenyltransferase alpha-alpha toroid [Sesbania bispinosa]
MLVPINEKAIGPLIEKANLIDSIQRLGLYHHFEHDIGEVMQHIHSNYVENGIITLNVDVHSIALLFRLLRQPDVFKKFKNEQGNFSETLIVDVEGLLSLYEAAHLRIHGEEILDEALAFTSSTLELMTTQLSPSLAAKVNHSLKRPLCKNLSRLVAMHYISTYEEDPSHDANLLLFAKLDFNMLQDYTGKKLDIFQIEAKWFNSNYVPTVEEYMCVARVTTGYCLLATTSFIGMGSIATEKGLPMDTNNPKIVKASIIICRLMDDIVSNEFEQKRGHVVSALECYMKQHGVSRQNAINEFQRQVAVAWKDMNEELLDPTEVPKPLLKQILNLSCVMDVLYKDEDCYTHAEGTTKNLITALLLNPWKV